MSTKMRRKPDPMLGNRFLRAFQYAMEKHKLQPRKGKGVPYLEHLMGVCSIALHYGANEDEAMAALLHDVVEDCGGEPVLKDVRRKFGKRVAEIVEGCTDDMTGHRTPWEVRKQYYIAHVRQTDDNGACLVSAADKLHNARAILADYRDVGERVWDRFSRPAEKTLWYYRSIIGAFRAKKRDRRVSLLVDELERVVRALHRKVGLTDVPNSETAASPV